MFYLNLTITTIHANIIRVDHLIFVRVGSRSEWFRTYSRGIRFFSCMYPHVFCQVWRPSEWFWTHCAFVSSISCMYPHVFDQVWRPNEWFRAYAAWVRFISRMYRVWIVRSDDVANYLQHIQFNSNSLFPDTSMHDTGISGACGP